MEKLLFYTLLLLVAFKLAKSDLFQWSDLHLGFAHIMFKGNYSEESTANFLDGIIAEANANFASIVISTTDLKELIKVNSHLIIMGNNTYRGGFILHFVQVDFPGGSKSAEQQLQELGDWYSVTDIMCRDMLHFWIAPFKRELLNPLLVWKTKAFNVATSYVKNIVRNIFGAIFQVVVGKISGQRIWIQEYSIAQTTFLDSEISNKRLEENIPIAFQDLRAEWANVNRNFNGKILTSNIDGRMYNPPKSKARSQGIRKLEYATPVFLIFHNLAKYHNLTFSSPYDANVVGANKEHLGFNLLYYSQSDLFHYYSGAEVVMTSTIQLSERVYAYAQENEITNWSTSLNLFSLLNAFDSATWVLVFMTTMMTSAVNSKSKLANAVFDSFCILTRQGVTNFTRLLCLWSLSSTLLSIGYDSFVSSITVASLESSIMNDLDELFDSGRKYLIKDDRTLEQVQRQKYRTLVAAHLDTALRRLGSEGRLKGMNESSVYNFVTIVHENVDTVIKVNRKIALGSITTTVSTVADTYLGFFMLIHGDLKYYVAKTPQSYRVKFCFANRYHQAAFAEGRVAGLHVSGIRDFHSSINLRLVKLKFWKRVNARRQSEEAINPHFDSNTVKPVPIYSKIVVAFILFYALIQIFCVPTYLVERYHHWVMGRCIRVRVPVAKFCRYHANLCSINTLEQINKRDISQ